MSLTHRFRSLAWTLLLAITTVVSASPTDGRVLKVLPHLLDRHGRHALAPSLFQRDAYQAYLRRHPDEVTAIRYDVYWQSRGASSKNLRLRLALRTANRAANDPLLLETAVHSGLFGRAWSSLRTDPDTYKAAGKILAWQVTLLDGDTTLATQKSFLW